MPALGADMTQGTVVQWLVSPGARVRQGDVVAVVETQKGAIDVEIFLDGIIEGLAPVGTRMTVGEVLAQVREPGEAAAPAPVAGRVAVTPAARRRAAALGIDPASLHGTGFGGAVGLRDVEVAGALQAPAPATPAEPQGMRAVIAAAMSRSKREIPHYYLSRAVDFSAGEAWLAHFNAERPPEERVLAAALLLKASAVALAKVPQLNGFHEAGATRLSKSVHVGWAVSLRGGGLVAPAVHDANQRSVPELMEALKDLVQRARAGGLRSSELSDPTATVTSLGERGADAVQGIIHPPQLALIGFGRIAPRPWVEDGAVVVRPVVEVTLAADHRASDGHVGGLLLEAVAEALAAPGSL